MGIKQTSQQKIGYMERRGVTSQYQKMHINRGSLAMEEMMKQESIGDILCTMRSHFYMEEMM